jgi:transposase-like protein
VSVRSTQPTLPGISPLCPHCGERRRVDKTAEDESTGSLVSAERWECRACGRTFWSLPTLARGGR